MAVHQISRLTDDLRPKILSSLRMLSRYPYREALVENVYLSVDPYMRDYIFDLALQEFSNELLQSDCDHFRGGVVDCVRKNQAAIMN